MKNKKKQLKKARTFFAMFCLFGALRTTKILRRKWFFRVHFARILESNWLTQRKFVCFQQYLSAGLHFRMYCMVFVCCLGSSTRASPWCVYAHTVVEMEIYIQCASRTHGTNRHLHSRATMYYSSTELSVYAAMSLFECIA